jgi:hypothetical protein
VFAVGISAREFARRDRCSDTLVRRAGKKGKLKVSADGTYDPDEVGTDWRPRDRDLRTGGANTSTCSHPATVSPTSANTGRFEAPDDGFDAPIVTMKDALLAKEKYTAMLKHLEFQTKSGLLISAEIAAAVMFQEFRNGRDAWLNWPTSVAPHMAAELGIDPDKLVEVLTRYVHEHLTELGEPAGDFRASGGNSPLGSAPRMDTPTTH